MKAGSYPIKTEEPLVFTFISEGRNGKINKIIRYDPTVLQDFYNLGFGDQIGDSLFFNDKANSDNGDIRKVIATVIQTIPFFFAVHPQKNIFIEGSDERRKFVYNWVAHRHYRQLENEYAVLGGLPDGIEEYLQQGRIYLYFIITKK